MMPTAFSREDEKAEYSALPPGDTPDESYWAMVKQQFAIPAGMMMVNSANLCPSPYFVNNKVRQFQEDLARDVSFQNREKFNDVRSTTLQMLSEFVGGSSEEVGITRNTSEGNNIVVNGLDLKRGDEVIIWDQNHPTNNVAWINRAVRFGFTVKAVSTPAQPTGSEDLISPFVEAMTSRTRVLAFSHLSNVTGILIPAKELCNIARDRGILTLVDGAQAFGAIDLDLQDLGCDFYTASTHKWLMGPMENGLLYVKVENIARLWPDSISPGWSTEKSTADEKFCSLGQRNETTAATLPDILEFHQTIGKKKIQNRIRDLHNRLKEGLKDQLSKVEFITPLDPALSGGVTIFNIPGKDHMEIYQGLYDQFGIAGAPVGGVRLCPTIHNTLEDMDTIVDAVVALT